MFFEILLLSVIVATAYLGPMVLRRSPPGRRLYGWMLVADLVLAIVAFAARGEEPDEVADLVGAIAIGGAICLVLVPPVLRDLSRRCLLADRLRLALLVIDLRELLQPGMGARQERELVEAIVAVRSGKVEAAVEVLREARATLSDPLARRQIDERIVMTYLYARHWDQAITHFESTLDGNPGPTSPQLLVEMVRAFCEVGELDKAATLVEGLEDSPIAEEPLLAFLLNRSRMVFLAFVGRTTAVEAIVAPSGPLGAMPAAARQFWAGVARLNAGDRSGARSSLEQAARLSGRDRRARDVAEKTLDSIDEPGVVGPHAVSPPVAELADRLTTLATNAKASPQSPAQRAPKLAGVSWRQVPTTTAVVVSNIVAAIAVALSFGSSGDIGGLVIAGANLKSAVAVGEWWRLPASMFLHVGILHLVLNMYGLWILGRLVEQMFGSLRFFVVYMSAGLVGALASFYFGAPGLSAGASGAVFGVLGAATVELAVHRQSYPERWRRALLGNLIFLTLANVAIGFYYPAIDQSAHLGGLVAGAAVAALVSPRAGFARGAPLRAVVSGLALFAWLALGYAAYGVATTDYGDTLARYEVVERRVEGFRLRVPADWQVDDRVLVDSSGLISLAVVFVGVVEGEELDLAAELSSWENLSRGQVDTSRRATRNLFSVGVGWQSRELVATVDGLGGEQHLRVLLFGKTTAEGLWLGKYLIPEALAADSAAVLDAALASVERTD